MCRRDFFIDTPLPLFLSLSPAHRLAALAISDLPSNLLGVSSDPYGVPMSSVIATDSSHAHTAHGDARDVDVRDGGARDGGVLYAAPDASG